MAPPPIKARDREGLIEAMHHHHHRRAPTRPEVNPDHAPDEAKTFEQLITMTANALSRRHN